jgi:anti-anti-sigma factor
MDIVSKKWNDFDVLEIHGRIDGMTSAGLKHSIDLAAAGSHRNLVLDFAHVSYMSSAGLRVILQCHKALQQIGGKLTLVSVPSAIMDVFNISGMVSFLHIPDDLNSLISVHTSEIAELDIDGIRFEWRKTSAPPGKLFSFGSGDKLMNSSFERADAVGLKPAEICFGAGLAALGDDYDDYKTFFGEAIVINHHFFSYPAVSKPVADYSYFSPESQHSLNFLYGFGINGEFSRILRFDSGHNPLSLQVLMDAAGHVADTGLFGVVILGVSGGINGMHLKNSPVLENQPGTGNILDAGNFPRWMNFSIDSEEINKTIVAFGVVEKTPGLRNASVIKILPGHGNMHFHAAVFENGLWSNHLVDFERELLRVLTEFEPHKVVHLLPGSKLKSGYLAIINLEEN